MIQKSRHRRGWSEQESDQAVVLYWQGLSYSEIGAELGRPIGSVCSHLVAIKWGQAQRTSLRRSVNIEPGTGPQPSDEQQQDRVRRQLADPRDLTAAICGDPVPGYSALERRGTQ